MLRRVILVGLLTVLLLSAAPVVTAHGYIVRAIPENRAVLERAPTRVQYWFSESLERDFSSLNVRNQSGEVIASGGVSPENSTLLAAQLPADLPDGAYVVELRPAFASDGHVYAESRVFFVGEEIGGVAGSAGVATASPLEVVWKAMTSIASLILLGAFVLYGIVLYPAWGSLAHPAGGLPPRVMLRLHVIVGGALGAAFVGEALALIQQTMSFFNIGFWQALNPDFWSLVRVGSRFGDIWNARIFFLGIVGTLFVATLRWQARQPELVRPFWLAGGWIAALVIGSASVISHAAGSLLLPWVGMAADWLHALAVSVWAGGLIVLVLVLPVALAPYSGEARRLALLAALRRFSGLAQRALALVIATGIYSASTWLYDPADVTTPYGASLAFKLTLAAGLIAVGAAQHIALRPERYARFNALIVRVGGFMPALRLEALLALPVLCSAALLSATPVPVPEFAGQSIEPPTEVIIDQGITAVMTISPGGPGVNTYDLTITRAGQRVEGLTVDLLALNPASDRQFMPQPAESIEPGLYVAASDEIDRPGRWWTLVNLTDADGATRRLAFDWEISAEAAVLRTLDPTPIQWATLGLLLVALGWVMYRPARQLVDLLDLNPSILLIAALGTVLPLGALAIGFVVLQQQRVEYAETLNPPPQVINAVLPTQASLERGAALFEVYCADWPADGRDFADLIDRLPRIRDEELFLALRDGWRGLSACGAELSFYQRWDAVNYLRSLADYS